VLLLEWRHTSAGASKAETRTLQLPIYVHAPAASGKPAASRAQLLVQQVELEPASCSMPPSLAGAGGESAAATVDWVSLWTVRGVAAVAL
jgi:hypothetical protein